jgi:outer membrane protein assembly factor BamB
LWKYKAKDWVTSSPAVTDHAVYVGSYDGNLHAIDRDNGRKLWTFRTEKAVRSSPIVIDDVVIFGSDDHFLYAVR